jgi:hydrogenase maturation protease
MKDVIIGIGNPIISDDRIGIYAAQRLQTDLPDVDIKEASFSGFYLLDLVLGYDRAFFIDSIRTGNADLGDVNVYKLSDFQHVNPFSIHSTDIISAIESATEFGLDVPQQYYFITIEIKDNFTFSESFSDEIESIKEEIYHKIKEEIDLIREL